MLRFSPRLIVCCLLANSVAVAVAVGIAVAVSMTAAAEQKADPDQHPPSKFTVTVNRDSVIAYVLNCRKANGAFGPLDQQYTDAAWNYPAVATLAKLDYELEDPAAVLEHGLGFPTGHAGASHWLLFHQALLQDLLDAPVEKRPATVRLVYQPKTDAFSYYGHPLGRDRKLLFQLNAKEFLKQTQQAEQLGYYNLSSLFQILAATTAREQRPDGIEQAVAFIKRRQAPNGGFVDLRGREAKPENSAAHVATTYYALASLAFLNARIPNAERCAEFIHTCQGETGAFRAKPATHASGNREDIYYTFAALRGLRCLKVTPRRPEACATWINRLQNADGGFGDQPGWRSRLYSTLYAVDSLAMLSKDGAPKIPQKQIAARPISEIPQGKFQIYQGLNKVPVCATKDLPGLLKRKLNLLAMKSDNFTLAEELQAECRAKKLPMDVVLCLEAYPHRALREADLVLHHLANITLDPSWTAEEKTIWEKADTAGRAGLPWRKYQTEVLTPLQNQGCLIYPEQDFDMDLAYAAYDAGLDGPQGYQAVLAGFNWAPRDFIRVFPWRERYVDKLTPVADCDAHGDLAKWSPQLDYCRHLYLATGPSYAEFLAAAAAGRVVCAIVDAPDDPAKVTLYGPPAAVQYARRNLDQWRWWPEKP